MSQIKQILSLHKYDKSIKFVARTLSLSRNTVRKYLALQQASGHKLEELLELEDNQLQQMLMPEGEESQTDRYQTIVRQYEPGINRLLEDLANHYHVQLGEDKHYYSVPHIYVNKKVKIIYTTRIVQIFFRQELIATHYRDRTPFGYTSVKEHLPSHHQHWLDRSPQWYRNRAHRISPQVGELIERILTSRSYPEQAFRSCDGVLGLHRKIGSATLTRAATIALELDCCTYSYIKRLIHNGMAAAGAVTSPEFTPLPRHENIRGKDYYRQSFNL